MASAHNKVRLPGAIATFGLAVGYLADALEGTIPSFHQVLQQPAIIVLVPIITLVTIAALVLWAQQGGSADREAFVHPGGRRSDASLSCPRPGRRVVEWFLLSGPSVRPRFVDGFASDHPLCPLLARVSVVGCSLATPRLARLRSAGAACHRGNDCRGSVLARLRHIRVPGWIHHRDGCRLRGRDFLPSSAALPPDPSTPTGDQRKAFSTGERPRMRDGPPHLSRGHGQPVHLS